MCIVIVSKKKTNKNFQQTVATVAKVFNKRSLVMLATRQERGEHGEHCGVTLQLSF